MTTYLTFGVQYASEPHPSHPQVHPDGYVRIEAGNYASERELVIREFGTAWAFTYDHKPEERFCPLGEIGVLETSGMVWHEHQG